MNKLKHNYCGTFKNVRIRPLEKDDIERLRVWRNDKDNSVHLSKLPYITEAMQLEWYEKYLNRNDEIVFAIEETVEFNRVVGSLSLYEIKEEECLFGKILIGDADTRGHGIGTNATIAAIEVAIEKLGIHRILLYVYKENESALGAYRHVGFKIIDEHCDSSGKVEYTMEYRR